MNQPLPLYLVGLFLYGVIRVLYHLVLPLSLAGLYVVGFWNKCPGHDMMYSP